MQTLFAPLFDITITMDADGYIPPPVQVAKLVRRWFASPVIVDSNPTLNSKRSTMSEEPWYEAGNNPMTLDEAITHAQDRADSAVCGNCGDQHQQLANWLRELKEFRTERTIGRIRSYALLPDSSNKENK